MRSRSVPGREGLEKSLSQGGTDAPRLAMGYGSFRTAWKTLQGIETMHMINKGRVRWLAKGDVVGQVKFIHTLFAVAV